MFNLSSMWDVNEPTHYKRRVGREVLGVVAVLCECTGGYRKVIYPMGHESPVRILRCTPVQNWTNTAAA